MKDVLCYELFRGIALNNYAFILFIIAKRSISSLLDKVAFQFTFSPIHDSKNIIYLFEKCNRDNYSAYSYL